ncbi:MAG: hypothetical protein ABWY49_08815 [Rhizobium sp.]
MFAGRYLWWMLLAIATFALFAIYFDFAGWLIVELSGCTAGANSCGPLTTFLAGTVRPAGFSAVGFILLICTLARICYLRLSLLWGVAATVWCLSITSFPALFKILWDVRLPAETIFYALPLPLLFLAVLVAYLLAPFEDTGRPVFGPWRRLRTISAAAAAYGVLLTVAEADGLAKVLSDEYGLATIAAAVKSLQPRATYLLQLGTGGDTPAYFVLAGFALSLLASLVPEERVLAALEVYERLKLAGWPRRHRDRAGAAAPEEPGVPPSLI